MGRRRLGRFGTAVALAGLAVGCQGEAASEQKTGANTPAYGDTMVEASIGNVSSLIPNITSDQSSHEVGDLMYNGLVTLGRDLELAPELAKSWTFSKDCLTLDFKLHERVKWHDGAPFTADDVVFTWATLINPKTPSPYKSDFNDVERVDALDRHTVRVTYKKPYAKAVLSWAIPMLPRHLLERWVKDGKIKEAPQNWSAPVGTGP